MHKDAMAWLRWVLIPNLGLKRSQTLLSLIDSPDALFLYPERWPLPDGIKATIREMNLLGEQHPIHRRAAQQLDWAQQSGNHLLFPDDHQFPLNLSQIDDAPMVLWGVGNIDLLNQKQVAMVGSRHASPSAIRHSKQVARELAGSGITITSGGAAGIDGACHQAALDASGTTIAVFGCGVDVVYPKQHRALFSHMSEQSLLLSEYPLGTQPRPGHFPRRNRIISALADVLVVCEAALNSGSLVTAQHALEQGKDIFAMPGDIGNPNSEGCHKLIKDGAYLLSHARDILHHLQWQSSISASDKPVSQLESVQLNPIQQQIIENLKFGMMPIDVLGHQLNLAVHQLLEPILELELEGLIEQQPGGYTLSDIA